MRSRLPTWLQEWRDLGVPAGIWGLVSDGSGGTPYWDDLALGGGGAPIDCRYLVLAADPSLTMERVLTPGAGLLGIDSGAGAAYTLRQGYAGEAIGDLSVCGAVGTWARLAAGTAGYPLVSGGAGVVPSYAQISHAGALTAGSLLWTASGHTSAAAGDLPFWSAPATPAVLTASEQRRVLSLSSGLPSWVWSIEGPYRVFQAQSLANGTIDTTGAEALSASHNTSTKTDDADGRWVVKSSLSGSGQVAGLYPAAAGHGEFDQVRRGFFHFKTPSSMANRAFWIGFVDPANLPPTAAPWQTYTASHACLRCEVGTDGATWVFSTGNGAGGQTVSASIGASAASTAYACVIEQTTISGRWDIWLWSQAGDTWTLLGTTSSTTNLPAAATLVGEYARCTSELAGVTAVLWLDRIQGIYL